MSKSAPIPRKPAVTDVKEATADPELDTSRGYQEIFYGGKAERVKYIQDGNQFAADGSFIGKEY